MTYDFENMKDSELVSKVGEGLGPGNTAAFQIEMMRRLKNTIEKFNENSLEQSQKMINLTNRIKWFTIAMVVLVFVQIILIFA